MFKKILKGFWFDERVYDKIDQEDKIIFSFGWDGKFSILPRGAWVYDGFMVKFRTFDQMEKKT